MPAWLREKPDIPFGLTFYYRAFSDLTTCRPIGMSEGRIPWTAVNDYAIRLKLSDVEFEELWEIVSRLDSVYIESRAAKAKIEQNRIGGQQGRQNQKPRR